VAKTIAEMLREEGRREGNEQARREEAVRVIRDWLLRLLRSRFGKIPARWVKRIEATEGLDQLGTWFDEACTASELSQVSLDRNPPSLDSKWPHGAAKHGRHNPCSSSTRCRAEDGNIFEETTHGQR
jgi:hypothetical protein